MDLLTDEDRYGPEDWYYYKVLPVQRRRRVSPRVAGVGALCLLLALCYVAGVVLHAVCAP